MDGLVEWIWKKRPLHFLALSQVAIAYGDKFRAIFFVTLHLLQSELLLPNPGERKIEKKERERHKAGNIERSETERGKKGGTPKRVRQKRKKIKN